MPLLADRDGMSAVVPESRSRVVTDFRKPVLTLVEVSWTDAGGTVQTVGARMEDKSVGGARIRVKTPIVVGSEWGSRGGSSTSPARSGTAALKAWNIW